MASIVSVRMSMTWNWIGELAFKPSVWFISQKERNRSMHALNGNSMTKEHKKENNKESPFSSSIVPNREVNMPSRIDNCAGLVDLTPAENGINHEPAYDIETAKPWSSWEELLKIASEYKLLRYSPTEVARMRKNL